MPHVINQIIFSMGYADRVKFTAYEVMHTNLNIDDIFCDLSLIANPDNAQDTINALLEGDGRVAKKILPCLLTTSFKGPLVYSPSTEHSDSIADHLLKYVVKTNTLLIHWSEGKWYVMTKNQQAQTQGFMPINDFITHLYTTAQYPKELVEMLLENKAYPLRVFEVENYGADSNEEAESVFKLCPIYLDAPENLQYEDNYVLDGEFVH